ncbi:MAG: N-acetyl-gamma-glutamyl-phosphate reductase [Verrucomicrobia bacterium]|nr:N-acetyl-gamma-glutamyl-phosphate reductase [Verrucomicrobiota bacterium]MCG2680130.1 N-acetyl-gamma-glutamyl-phosphate reductase [Kiritimatiellia bacterium]MBU4247039.1 N-acetyl-gamma-glutamyl-phosphate reductase [Verrucomicrobiota bacterium]MBU4291113.1 N-acetyl-gamma-glutamyl-phosphate reductase [Verrucomicrobiota bacterium]MBU4429010.1 N-acetyl-gamma-glutamyl-phosphate reductase [Verrucomicrobiota bacterium]
MIKVKIIGAGGYGGVGITELLMGHPRAKIACLVDVTDVGVPISKLYPHLTGFCDLPIIGADDPKAKEPVDVVFMATPDGVGMKLAPAELKAGVKVIDYSGDFRFNSTESYAEYATRIGRDPKHASPELLPPAVYGLTELHRKELGATTRIVGNPGCFAVSCILGLAPAVKQRLIRFNSIICDCKTGVSGAGKKPSAGFHYPARYDHMNAYKLAGHQHVCEIERELGLLAGTALKIAFTAQVVPVCRGIMSSLYGELADGISADDVASAYREFYRGQTFVRLFDRDSGIGSAHVRGTNYCNLIVDVDARTNKLRIISHIDNLMKGQAGSALQNMNLLFGFPETDGLNQPGKYP